MQQFTTLTQSLSRSYFNVNTNSCNILLQQNWTPLSRPLAIVYSGQICLQRFTKTVSILIGRLFWESFKTLVCQRIWQLLCRLRSSKIEADGLKKKNNLKKKKHKTQKKKKHKTKETNAFYFCVVVFLLPPSYYFKGCCCLSYIIWSTWLVSAVKQDCGKPVCVEWYCSDLVGQIPTIVVLFKGKGCLSAHNNMLCLGINACSQNITVNYQIYYYYFFYFFISGILKCFLSSVAHLTSFEIRYKKRKETLPTATFQIKGRTQVMLLSS